MKKLFSQTYMAVAVFMVVFLFSSVSALASERTQIAGTTESGLTYDAQDNIAVITGYVGENADVIIPSSINGNVVTGIADGAFLNNGIIKNVTIEADIRTIPDNCFSNSSIVGIALPGKLRSIGSKAFANCISLTTIELPSSLQKIDREVFLNCSNLTAVVIPEGISEIKESTFKNCSSLTQVTLPNTLKTIWSSAFESCIKLNQIIIPDSLTDAKWGAFYGCTGLEKVVLSANLTEIPPSMFQGCTSLKDVKLSDNLTYIGNEAFLDCTSLEKIDIPDSCVMIMPAVFKNCTSLKEITLPAKLDAICGGQGTDGTNQWDSGTFYGCTSLKSIVIPDGCRAIDMTAFKNCTSLTSVYIPASVTSIAENAFDNCYFMIISAPKGSTGLQFAKNNYFRYVELTSNTGQEAFNGEISAGVIDDLKETEKLSILSGDISIVFDEKAVLSIKAQCAGSNVEIQYQLPNGSNIAQNDLKKAIKEVLNIGGKVVDLHLLNSSNANADVLFGKNGGSVMITAPYSAPSGATGVSLFYIDDNGKETEIKGTYNSKDKMVTFTTNHFSYYSIVPLGVKAPVTTPVEPEETTPESTTPGSTESAKPETTEPGATEGESTMSEDTEAIDATEVIESTETIVPESTEEEDTESLPSEDKNSNNQKDGVGIGTVILIAVLAMGIGAAGCWFAFNYYIKTKWSNNDSESKSK